MTSLALLAHTSHAAAPAFDGLFYATVIPVLYIALAVQARAGSALSDTAWRTISTGGLRRVVGGFALLYIASAIVAGAALAEILPSSSSTKATTSSASDPWSPH
jgi:hypothetical protein